MSDRRLVRSAAHAAAWGVGLAAGAYTAYAATAWLRYGRVSPGADGDRDPLLDRFMPTYEIVERHRVLVGAPACATFKAACDVDLQQSRIVRAIFRGRELALASNRDTTERPRGLLAFTTSIGWGILAEVPGREVVVGAVTEPWKANVVFRALPPDEFAAFKDPGYVKIAWTLRADPVGDDRSWARTEMRATTTDGGSRARFRRYWSIFSPGIVVIRYVLLRLVKANAERAFSRLELTSASSASGEPRAGG